MTSLLNSIFSSKPIPKQGRLYLPAGSVTPTIRSELRPFDTVLFCGDDIISNVIKFAEKLELSADVAKPLIEPGAFSHIGIIVTSEILDHQNVKEGDVYIWESTISGALGAGVENVDGRTFLGVQLRNFDMLLPAYDEPNGTRVAISHLINNPLDGLAAEGKKKLKAEFTELFNRLNGTIYQINVLELASALFKKLRGTVEEVEDVIGKNNWIFCSELVAIVYKTFGILPDSIKPEYVVPMDFLGYDNEVEKRFTIPIVIKKPEYIISPLHYVGSIDSKN